MSHRRFRNTVFVAWLLTAAVFAFAGQDFWDTKPYTEWTDKDVEKILLKGSSPWTETYLPPIPSSGGSGSPEIIINWYARPIREAVARQMLLRNPQTPKAQLDGILNDDNPKFIQLLITNLPLPGGGRGGGGMTGGGGGRGGRGGRGGAALPEISGGATTANNEAMEKFKNDTFLQKKSGEKIPLADMVMSRGRGTALRLLFAKEVDGNPSIVPDDKEITLSLRIGERTIKFKFKLQDMTINGKLEI